MTGPSCLIQLQISFYSKQSQVTNKQDKICYMFRLNS